MQRWNEHWHLFPSVSRALCTSRKSERERQVISLRSRCERSQPTRALRPRERVPASKWAGQVSNLRHPACKASALPLSYPPGGERSLPTRGAESTLACVCIYDKVRKSAWSVPEPVNAAALARRARRVARPSASPLCSLSLSGDIYRLLGMGEMRLITGQPVFDHGIYQSACGCRTALTVPVGQTLPRCLGCDEVVEWLLVQHVRPSMPAEPPRLASTVRMRAVKRRRLDSASGED